MGSVAVLALIPLKSGATAQTADDVYQETRALMEPHRRREAGDELLGTFSGWSPTRTYVEIDLPPYVEYGDETDWQTCPICQGTGQVETRLRKEVVLSACPTCFGEGQREKWRLAANIIAVAILPRSASNENIGAIVTSEGRLLDRDSDSREQGEAKAQHWAATIAETLSRYPNCWAVLFPCYD